MTLFLFLIRVCGIGVQNMYL